MALALTSQASERCLVALENALTYTPEQVAEYRAEVWEAVRAGWLPISAIGVVIESFPAARQPQLQQ